MPPPRRTTRRPAAPAPLPALTLAVEPPEAVVLAVPTLAEDGGARLAGTSPVEVDGLLARESAKGAAGELVSVPVVGDGLLERVLLVGLGDRSPAALRKAGAALARRCREVASLAVDLRGVDLEPAGVQALAEGVLLASYRYSRKKEPVARVLLSVSLVGGGASEQAVATATTVCLATVAARDLVNAPALEKSPAWLASSAVTLLTGLSVTVLDDKELAARGFGGLVAVGQGSARGPRLVQASYDGGGSRHVVLVGKGITFDTGGLSLKPNAGMLEMKSDMGGAAAVLATLRAVADLALPIKVTVLAAVAENMPSGTAQRPGDVLTQYGGRTVEVLNTDAEGRLVLADALAYAAAELAPDLLVDLATLTGAMPVALGKKVAGFFCTDETLAAGLTAAATASGEQLWRMPLVEDYRAALDSPVADLRNIGQPKLKLSGGAITAALFLREFTAGLPWAHVDIAGPAFTGADDAEVTKGGTGYGVRLLVAWLTALAAEPAVRTPRRPARRSA